MEPTVYKVCSQNAWNDARQRGAFTGSPDDLRDGYIHLSTARQLPGTLAKHFAGQIDLVLISFQSETLGAALRWEPSRAGELFPHYYGDLPAVLALSVAPLPLGASGIHVLPEDLA